MFYLLFDYFSNNVNTFSNESVKIYGNMGVYFEKSNFDK